MYYEWQKGVDPAAALPMKNPGVFLAPGFLKKDDFALQYEIIQILLVRTNDLLKS